MDVRIRLILLADTKGSKATQKGLSEVEKSTMSASKVMGKYRSQQAKLAAEQWQASRMSTKIAQKGALASKFLQEGKAALQLSKELGRVERGLRQTQKAAETVKLSEAFGHEDFERKLASTRYALYDVGRRFTAFGVAIGAAVVQSIQAFAKFESAFTSVERTSRLTGNSLADLRNSLLELSTDIPVAFADITEIATLGAQMGIAAESLDEFTSTVAKFATITGISVEQTALSFGRLAQLMGVPVSQFENLSSAITFAGINAVATDSEILKMSESIAAAATQAGFAADETIGYATALASLKVRPEAARGSILRLFRTIDLSVGSGGESLNDFAKILGKTSTASAELWAQDPSQFFASLIGGAEAGGQLNRVLTDLGITNSREVNIIQRLAGNMDVLTASLKDSREQFVLGTYASEAYGKVADDLNSKLSILKNTFEMLSSRFGTAFGEALKPLVDGISAFLKLISSVPLPLMAAVAAFTAIAAAVIVYKGVLALSIAGTLAMQLAIQNLTIDGIEASISMTTLKASLMAMTGQSTITAGALNFLGLSMNKASVASRGFQLSLGWVGVIGIVLTSAAMAFANMASSAKTGGEEMLEAAGGAEALNAALALDTAAGGEHYREIAVGVNSLTKEEILAREAAFKTAIARAKATKAIDAESDALDVAEQALADFRKEVEETNSVLGTNTALLGKNTAALIIQALSNYDGKGADFWAQLTDLDPATTAVLTELGFDAAALIEAGLEEGPGAEAYAQRFQKAMELISGSVEAGRGFDSLEAAFKSLGIDLTEEQFNRLKNTMIDSNFQMEKTTGFTIDVGRAVDEATSSVEKSADSTQIQKDVMEELGVQSEETGEQIETLSDALRRFAEASLSAASSQSNVYNAFAGFAKTLSEVDGEINNLSQKGRDAIGGWSDFMSAAIEDSIANDTGFIGSVEMMSSAITVLGKNGLTTGYQFETMKTFIIKSMTETVPALAGFKAGMDKAMDTASLIAMIDAQVAVMESTISMSAFMGASGAANAASFAKQVAYLKGLSASLKTGANNTTDFAAVFSDAMKKAQASAARAMTALQKLQETLNRLYSYSTKRMAMQESIASLGESLVQNGKTFSIWSESGRSNVSSLLDTIDQMAVMSNGNLQTFANYLGALRKSLVNLGASSESLKYIDKAIKATGKTSKVSAGEVDRLMTELTDSSQAIRSVLKVAEAVNKLKSSISAGLDAIYAQGNAVDDITIGWLDMADAADAANDSIAEAGKTIDDAKNSIDDANNAINLLAANKTKLEYQLQIALKYGDVLRSEELKAQIAELDGDVVDRNREIAESQSQIGIAQDEIASAQSKLGLNSTTRDIIAQNRALQDMAGKYGDVAAFMITTAKPGEDLTAIIDKQVESFKQNAIQMGYTQSEAQAVADVLKNELIVAMDEIPDDIKTVITADTDLAMQAVKSFAESANARLDSIRDKTINVTTIEKTVQANSGGSFKGWVRGSVGAATGGLITGPGTGTSDSISARLSNGEFVVKSAAVKHYGPDFFNSLNQMQTPSASMRMGSVASATSNTVYLSTEDRQLLRSAIDRPVALYTDNTIIAKSANAGNTLLAQRGIR